MKKYTLFLLFLRPVILLIVFILLTVKMSTVLEKIEFSQKIDLNIYRLLSVLKKKAPLDPRLIQINVTKEDAERFGFSFIKNRFDVPLYYYSEAIGIINEANPTHIFFDYWGVQITPKTPENITIEKHFKSLIYRFVEKHSHLNNLTVTVAHADYIVFFEKMKNSGYTYQIARDIWDIYATIMYYPYNQSYPTFYYKYGYDKMLDTLLSIQEKRPVNIFDPEENFRERLSSRSLISYQLPLSYRNAHVGNKRYELDFSRSMYMVNFTDNSKIPRYTLSDIIDRKVDPKVLEDKLIILGTSLNYEKLKFLDYNRIFLTPISNFFENDHKNGMNFNDIFVHFINSVLTKSEIIMDAPYYTLDFGYFKFTYLVQSIFFIFVIFMWWWLRPFMVFIFSFFLIGILFLYELIIINYFRMYQPLSYVLYTIFIALIVGAIIRLFKEEYIRWKTLDKQAVVDEANELKSNFISLISHNLNTPLAKIRSLSEVILFASSKESENAPKNELLDNIITTEHMERYFKKMLLLIKYDDDNSPRRIDRVNPVHLIERKIKMFKYLIERKSVKIHLESEPCLLMSLNSELFLDIFDMLLDNAVKFAFNGQEIFINIECNDQFSLQINVTGSPITDSEKEKIFNKYYRGANVDQSESQLGLGLGLYLAQKFTNDMGGSLELVTIDTIDYFQWIIPS